MSCQAGPGIEPGPSALKASALPIELTCIFSNNFFYGTELLFSYISMFSIMLTHGVAPQGLLLSTLVPIPKNKRGNRCDSNNYRQIAISSFLGKIFDTIILDKQQMSLETDVLQFGFKKNSSTVICTSILKETIDYYIENICYYWMPRRPLTELNIINYSIDCAT